MVLALLPVLLAMACGQSASEEALAYAVRACHGQPSGETLPVGAMPTDSDLKSWDRVPDEAADRAAEAAALDGTWRELAEAFSYYADASAEAADLWRQVMAVSIAGLSFPSESAAIRYRLSQSGIIYERLVAVDRGLTMSAKRIRSECRRVTALDR
jgi:hypothetical protein